MTERNLHRVWWLTLPVVGLFVAAIVVAKIAAAPAPAKAEPTLFQCSQDTVLFYGLDNTIHPGEIGFVTEVACNRVANIDVGGCLEQQTPFGTWLTYNVACAGKSRDGVLSASQHLWYSCTDRSTYTTQSYRGDSTYHIELPPPATYTTNIEVTTPVHGSRCLGPSLDTTNSR